MIARAIQEDRALVSSDTNFAAVLAGRQVGKLSVIVLKRAAPRRPEQQAELLLANRDVLAELVDQGCAIFIEAERLRSRALFFMRDGKR